MARKIEFDFESHIKKYNVTRTGYVILNCLHKEDVNSPSGIADFLGIDRAAVSRHLERLEKSGLIFRKRNQDNKRAVTLGLSKEGGTILEKLVEGSIATNQKLSELLTESEIRQLWKITSKVVSSDFGTPENL